MVCLPCIVLPFFLFIWHKFLQPIFLRFWNPWGKVEDTPEEGQEGAGEDKKAENGSLKCPIKGMSNSNSTQAKEVAAGGDAADHSKID